MYRSNFSLIHLGIKGTGFLCSFNSDLNIYKLFIWSWSLRVRDPKIKSLVIVLHCWYALCTFHFANHLWKIPKPYYHHWQKALMTELGLSIFLFRGGNIVNLKIHVAEWGKSIVLGYYILYRYIDTNNTNQFTNPHPTFILLPYFSY